MMHLTTFGHKRGKYSQTMKIPYPDKISNEPQRTHTRWAEVSIYRFNLGFRHYVCTQIR